MVFASLAVVLRALKLECGTFSATPTRESPLSAFAYVSNIYIYTNRGRTNHFISYISHTQQAIQAATLLNPTSNNTNKGAHGGKQYAKQNSSLRMKVVSNHRKTALRTLTHVGLPHGPTWRPSTKPRASLLLMQTQVNVSSRKCADITQQLSLSTTQRSTHTARSFPIANSHPFCTVAAQASAST